MSANSLEQSPLLGECSMGGGFSCGLKDSHNSYLHEKAKNQFSITKIIILTSKGPQWAFQPSFLL